MKLSVQNKKMIIPSNKSISRQRPGVKASYYQLPQLNGGTTIAIATFTGEHGERTIGDKERIYFIISGQARFEINNEVFHASQDDLVIIPANSKYNMWPVGESVKVILFSEYLNI